MFQVFLFGVCSKESNTPTHTRFYSKRRRHSPLCSINIQVASGFKRVYLGNACCGPIKFSWGAWTLAFTVYPLGLPGSCSHSWHTFSSTGRVSKCASASLLIFFFLSFVLFFCGSPSLLPSLTQSFFPFEPATLELVSWGGEGTHSF